MRTIILDTETTGLNARLGDRIIEIGCVELVDRRFTGNHFHRYLNPERAVEEGALKIHGLNDEFLADKPRFVEIVEDFLGFVAGAEILIHNAAFDVEFLDQELGRLDRPAFARHVERVHDTLTQARELHPGKKNSLDALCERYAIDNSQRTLHGALLDAHLLGEVYLAMTRGQESLAIEIEDAGAAISITKVAAGPRPTLVVIPADADEIAAHDALLDAIDKETRGNCLWLEKPATESTPA